MTTARRDDGVGGEWRVRRAIDYPTESGLYVVEHFDHPRGEVVFVHADRTRYGLAVWIERDEPPHPAWVWSPAAFKNAFGPAVWKRAGLDAHNLWFNKGHRQVSAYLLEKRQSKGSHV